MYVDNTRKLCIASCIVINSLLEMSSSNMFTDRKRVTAVLVHGDVRTAMHHHVHSVIVHQLLCYSVRRTDQHLRYILKQKMDQSAPPLHTEMFRRWTNWHLCYILKQKLHQSAPPLHTETEAAPISTSVTY